MRFVFLANVGRSGSTLTHVLLANHPDVRTTECFVSLNRETSLLIEKNPYVIKNICNEQLNTETSLWVLDYEDLGEKLHELNNHAECVCMRNVSEDSVGLIHVHNIFYDQQQFELFYDLISDNKNFSLILCERDWVQTISSRQRSYPLVDSPRWISILYWVIIEENAHLASQWISRYVETFHVNLLKWHTEPTSTWENLLSDTGIRLTSFPMQPQLRGRRWNGGNKSENVVGVNYVKHLTTNSLTKLETNAVLLFMNARNSILSRIIREIIFCIIDLAVFLMYLFRAIRLLPKNIRRKDCDKCLNSKRNRYSEIWVPVFANKSLNYFWHLMHVLRSGGAYDYRIARMSALRWKLKLRKMYKLSN